MSIVSQQAKQVAVASIQAMAHGARAEFADYYAADAVSRERNAAPPDARGCGPGALFALAQWLRNSFVDYRYEIHEVAADGELVAVNSTMLGRHVAPIIFYTEDAAIDTVFAATGRSFAMTQSHWFRMRDDLIVEHWANRDDLGMARQAGWVPPTPLYLWRCAYLKRRARHQARQLARQSS